VWFKTNHPNPNAALILDFGTSSPYTSSHSMPHLFASAICNTQSTIHKQSCRHNPQPIIRRFVIRRRIRHKFKPKSKSKSLHHDICDRSPIFTDYTVQSVFLCCHHQEPHLSPLCMFVFHSYVHLTYTLACSLFLEVVPCCSLKLSRIFTSHVTFILFLPIFRIFLYHL
jgi:hypothetical protein